MKTKSISVILGASLLALPLAMSGCDREVSHTSTTSVHSDGSVTTKEKTEAVGPDGSVTREESKRTTPANP